MYKRQTCNIAACIATSSPSSPRHYAPPLSTPLIPRRRHERSTPPPLPPSSMPSVFLDIKGGMPTVSQSFIFYWHCPHSMRSKVYETVGRPSVRLSACLPVCLSVPSCGRRTPLLRVCCCGPGGQEISITCCTTGAQQPPRRSSKCEQCHVVS